MKKNVFLVLWKTEDETYFEQTDAADVFATMSMSEYTDIEIKKLWLLKDNGTISSCQFRGKWHDLQDPFRMEIRCGRKVLEVGRGFAS